MQKGTVFLKYGLNIVLRGIERRTEKIEKSGNFNTKQGSHFTGSEFQYILRDLKIKIS